MVSALQYEWVLAIETSNPSSGAESGVGLGRRVVDQSERVEDLECVDTEAVAGGRGPGGDVVAAIDRLMARNGIAPKQLTRVGVSVGPGGFTAVRAATSVASMLSASTGAELVAVPTQAVGRVALRTDQPVHVVLASKREDVWLATFPAHWAIGDAIPGGVSVQSDEALARIRALAGWVTGDGYMPQSLQAGLADAGITVRPIGLGPKACLALTAVGTPSPADQVVPVYPREPEAVRVWQERQSN